MPRGRPLPGMDLLRRQTPQKADPNTDIAIGYGQQAGGADPTGKHTCFTVFFVLMSVTRIRELSSNVHVHVGTLSAQHILTLFNQTEFPGQPLYISFFRVKIHFA